MGIEWDEREGTNTRRTENKTAMTGKPVFLKSHIVCLCVRTENEILFRTFISIIIGSALTSRAALRKLGEIMWTNFCISRRRVLWNVKPHQIQHAEWNRFFSRSMEILLRICCMICRHLHATTVRSHLVLMGNTCNFAQIKYSFRRWSFVPLLVLRSARFSGFMYPLWLSVRCWTTMYDNLCTDKKSVAWLIAAKAGKRKPQPSSVAVHVNDAESPRKPFEFRIDHKCSGQLIASYRRRERMQWRFSLCQFKFTWSLKFIHFYRPDYRRTTTRFTLYNT